MMLTYAIKSAIILALLYICTLPVFNKVTFHRFNRILAVGSLLFSLLVPLLHIQIAGNTSRIMPQQVIELPAEFAFIVSSHKADVQPEWNWGSLVYYLYLGGAVVVTLVLLLQFCRLLYSLRKGIRMADDRGNTIVLLRGKVSPFCFFRTIVMSVDDYDHNRNFILTHEQEHIRLLHYLDLLIFVMTSILQWFNPFVWLLGKDLKAIHEYEVDKAVIHRGVDAIQYQKFLVHKAVGNRLQLFANNLTRGPLKSRIIMINQKKSSRWMMLKAFAVIPTAMLTLSMFATETANLSVNDVLPQLKVPKKHVTREYEQKTELSQSTDPVIKATTAKTTSSHNKIAKVAETMPEFPGGISAMMDYLGKNAKYLESAKAANSQGTCVVRFLVKKDGNIDSVAVEKTTGFKDLDEEAVRVVKSMPKWKPGTQNGKPVDVSFMAPLVFRLN